VCGQEGLRYLFNIENDITGSRLFPIGSKCIRRFGRADLDADIAVRQQLFKLLRAVENNSFITLNSELFSRKLLLHLCELGAFAASPHNRFEPKEDYLFMLKMFNLGLKRTLYQKRKVTAIILQSIKPFLQEMLREGGRRQSDADSSKARERMVL
ncbi:MAG: hypothetical protein GX096_16040, partial [Clostridiales bacterium]|nr:hypothetical protein [Clostridiales bacterium]